MAPAEKQTWDIAKTEYENALQHYRHFTDLRGRDAIFTTTVQVGVLTIIGSKLPILNLTGFLLSIVAVFSVLLGINNMRRLSAYLNGFSSRAIEIEKNFGMSLISRGKKEVSQKRISPPSAVLFLLYHYIFLLVWIIIWVWNLLKITNIIN